MANVEEALLLRAQQGNKEAFTQLIGQYRNDLYKIGKAILGNDEDIADAMQETILKCWQKLDTLKKAEYFKTLNCIFKFHRGVEFKYAIERLIINNKKVKMGIDNLRQRWYSNTAVGDKLFI